MSNARYVRRMSPMERLSLVIHEAHRYHVDGVLEGRGALEPAPLQAAIERAAQANPGIRVRLQGALGTSRWVDSGIAPQLRIMPLSDWDGSSERGARFLDERFEPLRGGPIADVLYVPCRDGQSRLVFRTAHAAIDGRGCMHWMGEVSRALRGETLLGSPSRLRDVDVHARYRNRLGAATPPLTAACLPIVSPSQQGRDPLRYIWRRVKLPQAVSHLLPKTAQFLAQWARRERNGEVAFTVPVDYRGLRTDEMGLGNLTGYLRVDVPEDATPRTLVRQLNERLRAYADCRSFRGAGLMSWMPVSRLLARFRPMDARLLYEAQAGSPSGGLVSMGNVKLRDYDLPGFVATGIYGIPGAVGKLNVLFGNTEEGSPVLFTAPAAYNHEGQLDELAEAYRRHFSGQESEA